MQTFKSLIVALLATAVAATPMPVLEARQDNCTDYSSVAAGTVCIHRPSDCDATYLVQSGDTCQTIGDLYGNFTLSEFYYWNPDVGQTCFGLQAYVPVCIGVPWYTFTPPQYAATGAVVPASSVPVPIMPGIVSNCTTYEYVGSGLTVDSIVAQNSITADQFSAWNTYVTATNPAVWANYYVCVGA